MNTQTKQLSIRILDALNNSGAELGNASLFIIESAISAFEQPLPQPK